MYFLYPLPKWQTYLLPIQKSNEIPFKGLNTYCTFLHFWYNRRSYITCQIVKKRKQSAIAAYYKIRSIFNWLLGKTLSPFCWNKQIHVYYLKYKEISETQSEISVDYSLTKYRSSNTLTLYFLLNVLVRLNDFYVIKIRDVSIIQSDVVKDSARNNDGHCWKWNKD